MRNRSPRKNKKSQNHNVHRISIHKIVTKETESQKPLLIAKKLFSSALSWIIVLITVGGFLFTIYPRISIEPGESLDPLQPFKTSFIIKNDGYWRLVDIDYSLTIDKMKTINNDRLEIVGFGGLSEKDRQARSK